MWHKSYAIKKLARPADRNFEEGEDPPKSGSFGPNPFQNLSNFVSFCGAKWILQLIYAHPSPPPIHPHGPACSKEYLILHGVSTKLMHKLTATVWNLLLQRSLKKSEISLHTILPFHMEVVIIPHKSFYQCACHTTWTSYCI